MPSKEIPIVKIVEGEDGELVTKVVMVPSLLYEIWMRHIYGRGWDSWGMGV